MISIGFLQFVGDIVQFPSFDYLTSIQIDAHLKQVEVTMSMNAYV
jgi:hypothetical protein